MQVLKRTRKQFVAALLTIAISGCVLHRGDSGGVDAAVSRVPVYDPIAEEVADLIAGGLAGPKLADSSTKVSRSILDARAEQQRKLRKKSVPVSKALSEAISAAEGHNQDQIKPAVEQISKSAKHHGVPPTLLAAVIHEESRFNEKAVSKAGAVGLSQIMPNVWSGECKRLSTIPGNVDCGAKVLKHYFEKAGSWEKALALYNVGPGNYQKSKKYRDIGYRYAREVMSSQSRIDQQLALLH